MHFLEVPWTLKPLTPLAMLCIPLGYWILHHTPHILLRMLLLNDIKHSQKSIFLSINPRQTLFHNQSPLIPSLDFFLWATSSHFRSLLTFLIPLISLLYSKHPL